MVLQTLSVERTGDNVDNQIAYQPRTPGQKSAEEHRSVFLVVTVSAFYQSSVHYLYNTNKDLSISPLLLLCSLSLHFI